MRDAKFIHETIERFKHERFLFSNQISAFTKHEGNVELLNEMGVALLLKSLLGDPAPAIRINAALGLGRMASKNEHIAQTFAKDGIIESLVELLGSSFEDGKPLAKQKEIIHQRRASCHALRSICKYGIFLANEIANAGGIPLCIECLKLNDTDLCEASAWLIDTIAGQGNHLTSDFVECGAVPLLISTLESSENGTRRAAMAALGTIAERSKEFAKKIIDENASKAMISAINRGEFDVPFIRTAMYTISQISQGGRECSQDLANSGLLPLISRSLGSTDCISRRFAASALRDIASQDPHLAQEIIKIPACLDLLIQFPSNCTGLDSLPAVMTLGYLCSISDAITDTVFERGGIKSFIDCLNQCKEDLVKNAAAWGLGQAAKQNSKFASSIADSGALTALVNLESQTEKTELTGKYTIAICAIIANLIKLEPLIALLPMETSEETKIATIQRIDHVLEIDPNFNRSTLVESGGLKLILELSELESSPYKAAAKRVARHFPQQIIDHYSPAYNKALLESLSAVSEISVHRYSDTVTEENSRSPSTDNCDNDTRHRNRGCELISCAEEPVFGPEKEQMNGILCHNILTENHESMQVYGPESSGLGSEMEMKNSVEDEFPEEMGNDLDDACCHGEEKTNRMDNANSNNPSNDDRCKKGFYPDGDLIPEEIPKMTRTF